MKVSSKIISGFLILMLLALAALAYQHTVINQVQKVNRDLSEINMNSATVGRMVRIAGILNEDCKKYFGPDLDPVYDRQITGFHQDFLDYLAELRHTARSGAERAAAERLADALDGYWRAFNRVKQLRPPPHSASLPKDLISAMDDLDSQSKAIYDTVNVAVTEQVAAAAEAGEKAQRVSSIAGTLLFLLGVIVAAVIVQSINVPLRRLTQGTRAIAKGQFWHRMPAYGKDEFAELASDFNTMSEKLGELDRMKKDFVSHVSHDLKAPLASIRQIMHLLLQEIPGQLNEQQRGLIQLSYNSAERLAAMVGNLLDISRMEAGSMEYEIAAHDIVPLIQGVTAEFDVQAGEKGIRLQFECEKPAVFVECDRPRLAQVIGNLFENALKFSPRDSDIVTRVGAGRGREVLISISDSGPGVPDGHKENVFRKFHQVKQGKKVAGQGVGLGLAICKTIVEAHRGQIWVEDNANGGSVFCFTLQPAAEEEIVKCGQSQTA
jgi:signal transduction histidine kinase